MQRAIEEGDPFKVQSAQEFYLRASEVLRRLDLSVETERRKIGEGVSKQSVEAAALRIAKWLRIAFEQFLAVESGSLMAIADLGEFKAHSIERFKGILHTTVKTSLKTQNCLPVARMGRGKGD